MFIAALNPTTAHREGIINKYLWNLFFVRIKNPKVNSVEGQGNPGTIVLSIEPSTKWLIIS